MTHSFRFTDVMENNLERCRTYLSRLTDIPEDELNDTMVMNFVLSRVSRDYGYLLDASSGNN